MERRTAPSILGRPELESVAFDVVYVIEQTLSFIVWELSVEPSLPRKANDATMAFANQVAKNAILEATLMFLRKLNAFFTTKKQNREEDDVYAFDFPGFRDNGWFLEKEEVDELNLRVGHITLREARQGKKNWPLPDWINKGLGRAMPFFDYLLNDFFKKDSEARKEMAQRRESILRQVHLLNSVAEQHNKKDGNRN